jgi:tetratricopeptide (TPR) repeat protein
MEGFDWKKHPMFIDEIVEGEENPLVDALRVAAEEEPPASRAFYLKESGNKAFKLGRERWADAIEYYSQALEQAMRCDDLKLRALILSNRAQVHLCLKNFRMAFHDAVKSTEFDPDNSKAFYRAAKAAFHIQEYVRSIELARVGLGKCRGDTKACGLLRGLIAECKSQISERAAREERHKQGEQQRIEKESRFLEQVQKRGILYVADPSLKAGASAFGVEYRDQSYFDEKEELIHWSMLLLYPEYSTSDWISDCPETACLMDVLCTLFPARTSPGEIETPFWDLSQSYVLENLLAKVELKDGSKQQISLTDPLCQVLSSLNLQIQGVPVFLISTKT